MKLMYKSFPARRISPADGQYFFGYYDLQPISGNLHLAHKIGFTDRIQKPGESAQIGLIEMGKDTFECLDTTEGWCFQQGAMLQWNPAAPGEEIIYNCFDGFDYYATVLNIHTGAKRYLDRPVANVSPDGKYALSINFERLYNFRPGYGYAGVGDPFYYENHSANDGIFLIDMKTGKSRLILSMEQIWDFYGRECYKGTDKKITVNHITFNTDASRFLFLVRDFAAEGQKYLTATITANTDGSDLFLLASGGAQSHYYWKDKETVIFYCDGRDLPCARGWLHNYIIKDKTHEGELVGGGFFNRDNHMSYTPDRKLLLTDTYPDESRIQHLRVSDLARDLCLEIGGYYSMQAPVDCRCDLHPRFSPDGRLISFDSTHEGYRGIYTVDMDEIRAYLDTLDLA